MVNRISINAMKRNNDTTKCFIILIRNLYTVSIYRDNPI